MATKPSLLLANTCKCEGDHEITEAFLVATMIREFGRTVPKRTLVVSNKLSLLYDECFHDVKNKLVSLVAIDTKHDIFVLLAYQYCKAHVTMF